MKQEVKIGQTDFTVFVLIRDTSGNAKTALVYTDIDIAYARVETDNDVTTADVAPATLASLTAVHTDWGFLLVSDTDHPGLYRLDMADAVFATGAWSAVVTVTGTGLEPSHLEFIMVPESPYSGVTATTLTGHTVQTADHTAGIADIPTVAEFNARTLVSADYTIVSDLGTVQSADHTSTIADIPTVAEFNARTIVSANYVVVGDLGTVQTGDNYAIVNHGTYGNAQLVRSTTPANTLDVSATGEAGLDFDNIKDATGAHTLTNITVPNVTLVATTTTNTDMVAAAPTAAAVVDEWESQSQLDPTGFHVNVLEIGGTAQTANDNGADINAILVDTGTTLPAEHAALPTAVEVRTEIDSNSTRLDANVSTRAPASEYDTQLDGNISTVLAKVLAYARLTLRSDAGPTTDDATELTAINADGGSGAGDYAATDSQEGIRDRGDAAWTTGSGGDATEAKQDTIIAAIGTPANIDSGGATLADNLKKIADDNAGATFDATTDSLNKIRDDRTLAAADYTVVSDLGVVQTADHTAGISDIPTVAEFNARTLVSADYVVVTDTIAGVTSVGTVTGNVDGTVSGVTPATAGAAMTLTAAAIDLIWDEVIETGATARQSLTLSNSFHAGKVSGGGTATINFRDLNDSVNRIQMTVNANGDRSGVTLNL